MTLEVTIVIADHTEIYHECKPILWSIHKPYVIGRIPMNATALAMEIFDCSCSKLVASKTCGPAARAIRAAHWKESMKKH